MYQTRNSNLLLVTCPLILLTTVYVPTPVQSHPYELVSAIVDREYPRKGRDEFTLDTYTKIEFAYVDDGISQVSALRDDGTAKIERFRTVDYHTMILGVVIFDTGNPLRMVTCRFKNRDDAKVFYGFLKPIHHLFHTTHTDVISVLQFDSIFNRAGRGSGACDDCSSDGDYHIVSAEGRLCNEILTRSANNRPLLRRFFIVDENRTVHMVFTSRTFNMKLAGNSEYTVMNIETKYFTSEILIQFKDRDTATTLWAFVRNNNDVDRRIALDASDFDLKLVFGDRFKLK